MIRNQMLKELEEKEIFEQAKEYAYSYIDGIAEMDVFPNAENLSGLANFDESLPESPVAAAEILQQLHTFGSPATTAQIGGRYFGYVDGGAIPVSLATKWMSDVWDQCGGLFNTSPLNAKLESVCENWLKEVFNLPPETVAGFVSGTSMANLSGLAAARFHLLKNCGWDINENGLNGAPKLRIIVHEQAHASVKKTLAMLGYGKNSMEWVPSDEQGRIIVEKMPKLDSSCMVILQAGNVNTVLSMTSTQSVI